MMVEVVRVGTVQYLPVEGGIRHREAVAPSAVTIRVRGHGVSRVDRRRPSRATATSTVDRQPCESVWARAGHARWAHGRARGDHLSSPALA